MIIKALGRQGWNRRLAAEELGLSRRALQYKLKEYDLLDEKE
jgi:DNA-binding NtrC family response regulator